MKILKSPIICEECKLPIKSVAEVMVEWIDDDVSISDIRVIHNPKYSPSGNCYKHSLHYHRQYSHLDSILKNQALLQKLGIKVFDLK